MRLIHLLLRLLGATSVFFGVIELYITRRQWPHAFGDPVVRGFWIGSLLFLCGLWLLGSMPKAKK